MGVPMNSVVMALLLAVGSHANTAWYAITLESTRTKSNDGRLRNGTYYTKEFKHNHGLETEFINEAMGRFCLTGEPKESLRIARIWYPGFPPAGKFLEKSGK